MEGILISIGVCVALPVLVVDRSPDEDEQRQPPRGSADKL